MQSQTRVFSILFIIAVVVILLGGAPAQAQASEPDGPKIVIDINPGAGSSNPRYMFDYRGLTYFRVDDGIHGTELWRTDGTAEGTMLFIDINQGASGSDPAPIAVANGILFFVADNGSSGSELWRTDGTASGTWMVKDINPGPSGTNLSPWGSTGQLLFFMGDDGVHGRELWKSDGTKQGTQMIKDLIPGSGGFSNRSGLGVLGNLVVLYSEDESTNSYSLYRSDGTAAGTNTFFGPVTHSGPPGAFYSTGRMLPFSGKLYLTLDQENYGPTLWETNGTADGTKPVLNASHSRLSQPGLLNVYNNALYITASCTEKQEKCIWKLPETTGNVSLFYQWSPSSLLNLTSVNGKVVFLSPPSSSSWNYIWWIFDETDGPTSYLCPDCAYKWTFGNTVWGNKLYFFASNTTSGSELWSTDGTADGTRLVSDINPGQASSNDDIDYGWIKAAGGNLYFAANDGINGMELWSMHMDLIKTYLPTVQQ